MAKNSKRIKTNPNLSLRRRTKFLDLILNAFHGPLPKLKDYHDDNFLAPTLTKELKIFGDLNNIVEFKAEDLPLDSAVKSDFLIYFYFNYEGSFHKKNEFCIRIIGPAEEDPSQILKIIGDRYNLVAWNYQTNRLIDLKGLEQTKLLWQEISKKEKNYKGQSNKKHNQRLNEFLNSEEMKSALNNEAQYEKKLDEWFNKSLTFGHMTFREQVFEAWNLEKYSVKVIGEGYSPRVLKRAVKDLQDPNAEIKHWLRLTAFFTPIVLLIFQLILYMFLFGLGILRTPHIPIALTSFNASGVCFLLKWKVQARNDMAKPMATWFGAFFFLLGLWILHKYWHP